MRIDRLLLAAGCILACLLLMEPAAQAHRVNVFCWMSGSEVVCESTFAGGSAVKGARMEVRAKKSGRLLLSGRTDAQGRYRFTPPPEAKQQARDLKVVCIADRGHQGFWVVRGGEYTAKGPGPAGDRSGPKPRSGSRASEAAEGTERTNPAPGAGLSPKQVERAVSRALRHELAPIKKSLAELRQDRVTVQDILGGLGYILGLTGVGLLFASRRR